MNKKSTILVIEDEMNDGSITAENEEGKGSKFTVFFPSYIGVH